MSCQTLIQNTAAPLVVLLLDSNSDPVTGLTFADVAAALKKDTNPFAALTLTAGNFVELNNGYYQINLAAVDTDTLGNLYLSLTGVDIVQTLVTAFVAATVPAPSPPLVTPPSTTNLFGFLYDASASPLVNASVSASTLSQPTVLFTPEGLATETDTITVTTDSQGFFTISLITGADVDIIIPAANYRRTLQVPAADTNLFSIP